MWAGQGSIHLIADFRWNTIKLDCLMTDRAGKNIFHDDIDLLSWWSRKQFAYLMRDSLSVKNSGSLKGKLLYLAPDYGLVTEYRVDFRQHLRDESHFEFFVVHLVFRAFGAGWRDPSAAVPFRGAPAGPGLLLAEL